MVLVRSQDGVGQAEPGKLFAHLRHQVVQPQAEQRRRQPQRLRQRRRQPLHRLFRSEENRNRIVGFIFRFLSANEIDPLRNEEGFQ